MKVIYNKETTVDRVMTFSEIKLTLNCKTKNEFDLIQKGITSDEEIKKHLDIIKDEKIKLAIKNNESVYYDTIGLFNCLDDEEECSCDVVEEYITPGKEFVYMRRHCY